MVTIKKEPQVGPGKYDPTSPKKTVAPFTPALPGMKPVNPKVSGITNILDQKLLDKDIKWESSDSKEIETLDLVDTLNNKQIETIAKILDKKRYQVKASAEFIKNMFLSEPELATIAANSGGDYDTLVSKLEADLLPGLVKGGGGENLPTRSIYKYNDEDVDAIINSVYQRKLMRPATPAELEEERTQAKIKLEQGTLTTTKKVKNPVTGKLEAVVTQEAGPTKEVVEQSIEERIKALNPDEADRTARIGFSSWLSQNVQGA
jgi:hypothetical protein